MARDRLDDPTILSCFCILTFFSSINKKKKKLLEIPPYFEEETTTSTNRRSEPSEITVRGVTQLVVGIV